jgi:diaminopimelate epimerase
VVFVDELEEEAFRRLAPRICEHPSFMRGVNVQFVRVREPHAVEAWVWERGAGPTHASGSSACAVAAAAVRAGLVSGREVEVRMPGGALHVRVSPEWELTLRGPVEPVYRGDITPGMLARIRELSPC